MTQNTPTGIEGLEPHPEGGWYRRTYTASHTIVREDGAERPAATLIEFFLPPGEFSAWHLVASDEMWIWHGPGPLRIQLGGTGARPDSGGPQRVLDQDTVQVLVPGGTWQRTLPGTDPVRVSCMVTPGFSFDDFLLHDD